MGENQRCKKKKSFDNFFSLLNLYMYLLSVQYLSRASLWINHPELLYFFIDVSQSLEILFWKQCTNNIKTKIITSLLIHVTEIYNHSVFMFSFLSYCPFMNRKTAGNQQLLTTHHTTFLFVLFNPLTSHSDWHLISPHNIIPESPISVTRI